jgi:hypothetical protein
VRAVVLTRSCQLGWLLDHVYSLKQSVLAGCGVAEVRRGWIVSQPAQFKLRNVRRGEGPTVGSREIPAAGAEAQRPNEPQAVPKEKEEEAEEVSKGEAEGEPGGAEVAGETEEVGEGATGGAELNRATTKSETACKHPGCRKKGAAACVLKLCGGCCQNSGSCKRHFRCKQRKCEWLRLETCERLRCAFHCQKRSGKVGVCECLEHPAGKPQRTARAKGTKTSTKK